MSENEIHSILSKFVRSLNGKRTIRKILIANNGIAAVKAIQSIRHWSYETFGRFDIFFFTAMATPEDLKSNSEFLKMVDQYIEVPSGPNNKNLANVPLITKIALLTQCDAVWAGWGHASENPKLPESLNDAGIIWIGPYKDAMIALGDKIGSTLIAQSTGMSVLPWSGSGITINYKRDGICKDVYSRACIHNETEAETMAKQIGLPVMIKASAGGGGKGIRKLESLPNVQSAYRQVSAEVPGPIFMMKLVQSCRHLEVQILADEEGQAMALFGRDCSLQRRHQKLVEEGPVSTDICPPVKWREMEQAAVKLCKEVGYVGAGTVEYLYFGNGEYCFLELNPRLQVEHPVSELLSGVNLPATQLLIAMGIALTELPQIRKLYAAESTELPAKFDLGAPKIPLGRHVIACRITAENPEQNFSPTTGKIHSLQFRSTPDVWGYFSVQSNGSLHEFADSQFGHLFAQGPTRKIARKKMVAALQDLVIRGEISTTVEYLRQLLQKEDFISNAYDTTWIERNSFFKNCDNVQLHVATVAGALYKAFLHFSGLKKRVLKGVKYGRFFSPKRLSSLCRCSVPLNYEGKKFLFGVDRVSAEDFIVSRGNSEENWHCKANIKEMSDAGLLMRFDGRSFTVYGVETPVGITLTVDGKTVTLPVEKDPSKVKATVPGKLVGYLVSNGAMVESGQTVAEVEVMKMILPLIAKTRGIFRQILNEGSVISVGDVAGRIETEGPNTAKPNCSNEGFKGTFPAFKELIPVEENSAKTFKRCVNEISHVLQGYSAKGFNSEKLRNDLLRVMRSNETFIQDFKEEFLAIKARLSLSLSTELNLIIEKTEKSINSENFSENESIVMIRNLVTKEIDSKCKNLKNLEILLHKYRNGSLYYIRIVLMDLLKRVSENETLLNNVFEGAKENLSEEKTENLLDAMMMNNSPESVVETASLLLRVLEETIGGDDEEIDKQFESVFGSVLRDMENLQKKEYHPVKLLSRKIKAAMELRKIGRFEMKGVPNGSHDGPIFVVTTRNSLFRPHKKLRVEYRCEIHRGRKGKSSGKECYDAVLKIKSQAEDFGLEETIRFLCNCCEMFLGGEERLISEEIRGEINIHSEGGGNQKEFTAEDVEKTVKSFAKELEGIALRELVFRGGNSSVFNCVNPKGLFWEISPAAETTETVSDDLKRSKAKAMKSHYVHDFPFLIEAAIESLWEETDCGGGSNGKIDFRCEEYGLNSRNGSFEKKTDETKRCGFVAWEISFKSPWDETTKRVMVAASDITHCYGTSSCDEAKLFCLASKTARESDEAFLYISANSGAKIGVADKIWSKLRVALSGGNLDYLYLTEADYKEEKDYVKCEKAILGGEEVYRLETIYGEEGLNVENLSASGAMASEMAQAYEETFTLSYVTGRSVGIGAYLVRLGQRVIQKKDSPILLTGCNTLNKILGDRVYGDNLQIGGPQIMANCGVSHLVVNDDLEGLKESVRWICFANSKNRSKVRPKTRKSVLKDEIDREIDSKLVQLALKNPRILITGGKDERNGIVQGIFDDNSFKEYQTDWAKSVIVGRARLGGYPVGIILPESKTTEKVIHADPASANSRRNFITQAGKVLFPDSSQKMAAAIRDFGRERLPLFVLANWRGFSGGVRDMAEEVVKFGADIVYALKQYELPVFVYLPPGAELRGGSWVVMDSMINKKHIEMYAAPEARGGVIEPEGTVDVKLKRKKITELARRSGIGAEGMEENYRVFRQAAIKFAELHDTAERMLWTGVIREVVPLGRSRRFFSLRLRYLLGESEGVGGDDTRNGVRNK